MFDFDKFKSEVYDDYVLKKELAGLPSRLQNPSPANLRDYALSCLSNGLKPDDLTIFQEFFDSDGSSENLRIAIRKVDLGKLKSVQNYLIGKTINPDEIIVKLIAVLTDFNPRPYHIWRKKPLKTPFELDLHNTLEERKISPEGEDKPDDDQTEEKEGPIRKPQETKKTAWINNKTIASTVGVAAILSLGIITTNHFEEKDCAYWNGEKYIAIDCSEKNIDQDIIHLKDKSLLSLKKITRPDTLTHKDAKKVWYSKINNEVEFFTSAGYHPLYREKSLKAATIYIIEKYGAKKSIQPKISDNSNN